MKANSQNALHTQYNSFIASTSEENGHTYSSPCPTLTVKINYENARGKTNVFNLQIAILSEILSSVKWRSHIRLKKKWEMEIEIAIEDKKVLKEVFSMLLQALDIFCFTADERIAQADFFWNTAARNRPNGIVIIPNNRELKTAGIVSNA